MKTKGYYLVLGCTRSWVRSITRTQGNNNKRWQQHTCGFCFIRLTRRDLKPWLTVLFKRAGRRGKENASKPFTALTSSSWCWKISLRNTLTSSHETIFRYKNFNGAQSLHRHKWGLDHLLFSFVCSSVQLTNLPECQYAPGLALPLTGWGRVQLERTQVMESGQNRTQGKIISRG